MTPCSLAHVCRRYIRTSCLHCHSSAATSSNKSRNFYRPHDVISQKKKRSSSRKTRVLWAPCSLTAASRIACCVLLVHDTGQSQVALTVSFFEIHPKCWCQPAGLYGVTTQKTIVSTFTALEMSKTCNFIHNWRLMRTYLALALEVTGGVGPLDACDQHVTCSRFIYI